MIINGAVQIKFEDYLNLVLHVEMNDGRSFEIVLEKHHDDGGLQPEAEVTMLSNAK